MISAAVVAVVAEDSRTQAASSLAAAVDIRRAAGCSSREEVRQTWRMRQRPPAKLGVFRFAAPFPRRGVPRGLTETHLRARVAATVRRLREGAKLTGEEAAHRAPRRRPQAALAEGRGGGDQRDAGDLGAHQQRPGG